MFTVIVKGISGTIFVFCTSQNMLINYSIIFLILALVYCHTKVIINQSNRFITSLLGFKKYNISLTYYVAIYTVCPYIHSNHPLTLPHDPSDTCHSQRHILFCFIFCLYILSSPSPHSRLYKNSLGREEPISYHTTKKKVTPTASINFQ